MNLVTGLTVPTISSPIGTITYKTLKVKQKESKKQAKKQTSKKTNLSPYPFQQFPLLVKITPLRFIFTL